MRFRRCLAVPFLLKPVPWNIHVSAQYIRPHLSCCVGLDSYSLLHPGTDMWAMLHDTPHPSSQDNLSWWATLSTTNGNRAREIVFNLNYGQPSILLPIHNLATQELLQLGSGVLLRHSLGHAATTVQWYSFGTSTALPRSTTWNLATTPALWIEFVPLVISSLRRTTVAFQ